ncbi:hypothetical protein WDU94_012533, partial [Cyamophila willieti]
EKEDEEVRNEETKPSANKRDFEFKSPEDKRVPRFLSFNNDVSNIRVEMVFAVPFLAIPIGGKDESGNTAVIPQVDINLKSLFATGVIVFMLFFVIPKLVKLYLPPAPSHRGSKRHRASRILRNVDEALHGHNIDSTACTQKFVCYAVSNAAQRVAHGQGSSLDKIVDGVLGIQWLRNLIRVDSIKEALNLSHKQDNCQIYHQRCPVTQGRLYGAAGSLLDAINRSKQDQSHQSDRKSRSRN